MKDNNGGGQLNDPNTGDRYFNEGVKGKRC